MLLDLDYNSFSLTHFQSLKKLCNHPRLVFEEARQMRNKKTGNNILEGIEDYFPPNFERNSQYGVASDLSGKLFALDQLLQTVCVFSVFFLAVVLMLFELVMLNYM
jgi:hypothetical protein